MQRPDLWTRYIWSHPANRERRVRALAQGIRVQADGRIRGRVTPVPLGDHSRLFAEVGSHASTLVAYANPPDFNEWQVWKRRLRRGDLFVDVGANIGTYTVLAIDVGAQVVAVEPQADAVERLRQNLDLNGYDAEIVVAALVGEEATSVSLAGDGTTAFVDFAAVGTTPATTLDAVLDGREVAGIKVDVEGAELEVLKGAQDSLKNRRLALIQLEWNDCSLDNYGVPRSDTQEFLEQFGYALFRPDGKGNLVPCDGSLGSDVFAAPV